MIVPIYAKVSNINIAQKITLAIKHHFIDKDNTLRRMLGKN
jgi:cytochrome b561